ncbi:8596_t:CDS:1, partial [Racocetra fulgida]
LKPHAYTNQGKGPARRGESANLTYQNAADKLTIAPIGKPTLGTVINKTRYFLTTYLFEGNPSETKRLN